MTGIALYTESGEVGSLMHVCVTDDNSMTPADTQQSAPRNVIQEMNAKFQSSSSLFFEDLWGHFTDCLWQTVIRRINLLQTLISDMNDRLFSLSRFDLTRERGTRGPLWSRPSFYLPLFTLVKVLSGLLVWLEGCNTLQWEIYRKGGLQKLCVLLSGGPF